MEIVPGILQFKIPLPDSPLGDVNAYLIEADDGWILLDTGWNTEEAFNAFEGQLKEAELDFKDISLIIITHVHPDHFGLAGRIKQLAGCEVAIHRMEQSLIESRYLWTDILLKEMGKFLYRHGTPEEDLPILQSASMAVVQNVVPSVPERALFGGEIITAGVFGLQVLWTPGHARGHICLYDSSRKILFTGDHILPVITPNISLHVQSSENPLGDYLRSLKSLRQLDVDLVLPAHENIFTDLKSRIDFLLDHHEQRKTEILNSLGPERMTAYRIASEISWKGGSIRWDEL
ncbi:MAG: MBL fold metallo-hydrolase, partial [Desulfatiglandales bacterium]|nr:MBL fold metallo-hydrolase [Desulfatiglandales bacterium]